MKRNPKATAGRLVVLAVALALAAGVRHSIAAPELPSPDLVSVRSYSGQFVAYASRSATLTSALSLMATNREFVRLEPTLVTVSCERIKQQLLRELNAPGRWRGTIYLVLYPARSATDTITIFSERFRDDWQYRVDLPDIVERPRYVRAVVQVLLFELANRAAQARAAEIPLWLVEGMSQLLLASSEAEIILPPPNAATNGPSVSAVSFSTRKETLLQQAQKKLRGHPPLSFEALSWPPEQVLIGEEGDLYSGSAELFVGELLRLPDGRACLGAMLAQLPQYYNWQFAFLGAFRTHFNRPLEVEKWWALSLTQASGRDAAQAWSLEESWQKLDQAIHAAGQVRTSTNQPAPPPDVSLQEIIRAWDVARQTQALNNTLRELGLLRLRITQQYLGLVQDYSQTIEAYLQERNRSASASPFSRRAGRRRAVEKAVQQLEVLDSQRAALRPAAAPRVPDQSPARPTAAPQGSRSGNTISSTNVS